MQKVLQRTAMAKKQAARKAALLAKKKESQELARYRHQVRQVEQNERQTIKSARAAQREDWRLGPLAPRRDVGLAKDEYGTRQPQGLLPPELPKLRSKKPKIHLFKGDRVVVLRGRDKGKIGPVLRVDEDRHAVMVSGLNLADIHLDEWQREAEESTVPIRTIENYIPADDVRLVVAVPDPKTNVPRDVIVDRIATRTVNDKYERYIPQLNLRIPTPKAEKPTYMDYEDDTLRIEIEANPTWQISLLSPPMPSSVIDELRHKYSRFRERHEPEYIEAKMEMDRQLENRKNLAGMRTPLEEYHLWRAEQQRQEREKQEATEDVLASIGEVMVSAMSRSQSL